MHIAGARKKIRVGDLLVEAGAITEDQLQQALEKQKEDGGRIGNVIIASHHSSYNSDGHRVL